MKLVQLGAWRGCLLCLSLFLVFGHLQASKFIANPAARLSSAQRTLIEQLWRPELVLSENLIRNGLKHCKLLMLSNWARLVQKLATDGSTVTIVTFGGSVTVGYKSSNTSYPEEYVKWMKKRFPQCQLQIGQPGSAVPQQQPLQHFALCRTCAPDADLVLREYSVNGEEALVAAKNPLHATAAAAIAHCCCQQTT